MYGDFPELLGVTFDNPASVWHWIISRADGDNLWGLSTNYMDYLQGGCGRLRTHWINLSRAKFISEDRETYLRFL